MSTPNSPSSPNIVLVGSIKEKGLEAALKTIRRIERENYPRWMRGLQGCSNWAHVASYCGCPPSMLIAVVCDSAYLLASPWEIADLAGKVTPSFMKAAIEALPKNRILAADCRAVTARWIRALAKRGKIELLMEDTWTWNEETMLHVEFKIPG